MFHVKSGNVKLKSVGQGRSKWWIPLPLQWALEPVPVVRSETECGRIWAPFPSCCLPWEGQGFPLCCSPYPQNELLGRLSLPVMGTLLLEGKAGIKEGPDEFLAADRAVLLVPAVYRSLCSCRRQSGVESCLCCFLFFYFSLLFSERIKLVMPFFLSLLCLLMLLFSACSSLCR